MILRRVRAGGGTGMSHQPRKPFAVRNEFVAVQYEGRIKRTIGPSPTETSPTAKPDAPGTPETGRVSKQKLVLWSHLPL
jgi:hypothetical protein